jgi:nicotinamide-nucleotide amidase
VAVSGIAGPGGGTPEKPVGTVWIAWDIDGLGVQSAQFLLNGNRVSIREAALCESLRGTISRLKSVLNED